MPESNGVLERQLGVEDPERSLRFHQKAVGCPMIDGGPDRLIALRLAAMKILEVRYVIGAF